MEIKETLRTLRLYFLLSGLGGIVVYGLRLRISLQHSDATQAVLCVISIALSLAFLYIGYWLAPLLRTASQRIRIILYVGACSSVLGFLLGFSRSGMPVGLLSLILTLLFIWYLLTNVQRLAEEAQTTPSPGPPPVVTKEDAQTSGGATSQP